MLTNAGEDVHRLTCYVLHSTVVRLSIAEGLRHAPRAAFPANFSRPGRADDRLYSTVWTRLLMATLVL
jgi:hypothetical protein